MFEVKKYVFSKTNRIPPKSGIYAWYLEPEYSENIKEKNLTDLLLSLLPVRPKITTQVDLDYGIKLLSKGEGKFEYGGNHNNLQDYWNITDQKELDILSKIISDIMVPVFTRPIYIGMAKNLKHRIADQHCSELLDYWDYDSSISRYLERKKKEKLSVEEVLNDLDLNHSFALEARIRGFKPSDLVIFTFYLSDKTNQGEVNKLVNLRNKRRKIEKIFQMISQPVCGRM